MTFHVNVGSWKEITSAHVNVGGTWKEITEGHVNVGGTWKQFYANEFSASLTVGSKNDGAANPWFGYDSDGSGGNLSGIGSVGSLSEDTWRGATITEFAWRNSDGRVFVSFSTPQASGFISTITVDGVNATGVSGSGTLWQGTLSTFPTLGTVTVVLT